MFSINLNLLIANSTNKKINQFESGKNSVNRINKTKGKKCLEEELQNYDNNLRNICSSPYIGSDKSGNQCDNQIKFDNTCDNQLLSKNISDYKIITDNKCDNNCYNVIKKMSKKYDHNAHLKSSSSKSLPRNLLSIQPIESSGLCIEDVQKFDRCISVPNDYGTIRLKNNISSASSNFSEYESGSGSSTLSVIEDSKKKKFSFRRTFRKTIRRKTRNIEAPHSPSPVRKSENHIIYDAFLSDNIESNYKENRSRSSKRRQAKKISYKTSPKRGLSSSRPYSANSPKFSNRLSSKHSIKKRYSLACAASQGEILNLIAQTSATKPLQNFNDNIPQINITQHDLSSKEEDNINLRKNITEKQSNLLLPDENGVQLRKRRKEPNTHNRIKNSSKFLLQRSFSDPSKIQNACEVLENRRLKGKEGIYRPHSLYNEGELHKTQIKNKTIKRFFSRYNNL